MVEQDTSAKNVAHLADNLKESAQELTEKLNQFKAIERLLFLLKF